MNAPLLSVCLITYNHNKYIREAIDSVLMQKVNFTWELIIADDFSTDGTREIVLEYKEKYPDFIKLILQKKNVGPTQNWRDVITSPKSKYIAYFEGDDYWTDPYKLQKQVDFLEEHPEFSLCFHNALIIWEDRSQDPKYFCAKNQKETSTIEDVVEKWFIPTASMVFRKEYITHLPEWFKDVYNGDYALHLLLADKGKIGYIDKVMSVYRKNDRALSGGIGKNIVYINNKIILLVDFFNDYTKGKYISQINKRKAKLQKEINIYLKYKKYQFLKIFNCKRVIKFLIRKIR